VDQRHEPAAVLRLAGLRLAYRQGMREIEVLKGASAALHAGEAVALVGPSGSGKSSLLHVVGLLDRPDSGEIVIDGRDCATMSDAERTRARRRDIGFVYQFHHLLPEFTALENVMLPQLILGRTRKEAEARARDLLGRLGLGERVEHRPPELSGGEQQRVAISRALANNPKVLLADEPTGNLDPPTADAVFSQLLEIIREEKVAALIATHNYDIAAAMARTLQLRNGLLVDEAMAR
jgi:lipoprotein-releasing system ATP-binding protein